jgi:hypothetical protein
MATTEAQVTPLSLAEQRTLCVLVMALPAASSIDVLALRKSTDIVEIPLMRGSRWEPVLVAAGGVRSDDPRSKRRLLAPGDSLAKAGAELGYCYWDVQVDGIEYRLAAIEAAIEQVWSGVVQDPPKRRRRP